MKRIFTKALCLVCAGALALSLAACGGKADSAASSTASSSALGSASDYDYQNFNYSDGLDEKGYWEGIRALDYVTLPEDFASVAIKRSDIEPTSEEVEEQISDLLSQYSSTEHITDRAAADGDTVNINYVGSVNNVEFTGGSAENYDLTLGSGTFIDGFEDQIIGHKPGETFDVNVTFPDGYSDSTDANGNTVTLSGQKAVFTVVLNYISESVLPELTDSWVASTFGTSNNIYTVEALRAYYQDQLYTSNLNTAVMDDLLENSTFKSIPQQVMDYQVNQCLNYYSTLAGYYGYDLDGRPESAGLREHRRHAGPPREQSGRLLQGSSALSGRGRVSGHRPHSGADRHLLRLCGHLRPELLHHGGPDGRCHQHADQRRCRFLIRSAHKKIPADGRDFLLLIIQIT